MADDLDTAINPNENPQISSSAIAPMYAPEKGGNPFIADAEHNLTPEPLTHMLGADFKKGFSNSWDLFKMFSTKIDDFAVSQTIQNQKDLGIDPSNDQIFPSQPEKFLTEDDWKTSPWFRKGLSFNTGVYQNVAELEAKNFDNNQLFQDEESRVSQSSWSKMAQGAAGFGGSMLDPLFILMIGTQPELGVTDFLARAIPIVKNSVRGVDIAKGVIAGGIVGAEAGTIDYTKEKEFQEPADPHQIIYSTVMGSGLGGIVSAFAPALFSKFGKDLKLKEDAKEVFSDQTVASPSNEAIVLSATGQLENGINPDITDLSKQAYFEKHNSIAKQAKRLSGETDDLIDKLQDQRDVLQDGLDKVNDQLKTESNQDELDNLRKDKTNLEDQIENHDALIELNKEIPDDTKLSSVKAGFKQLRTDEAETTFSTGDNTPFVQSREEELDRLDLENAQKVKDQFEQSREGMSKQALSFEKEANDIGDKFDQVKSVYNGIRNCLVGGS